MATTPAATSKKARAASLTLTLVTVCQLVGIAWIHTHITGSPEAAGFFIGLLTMSTATTLLLAIALGRSK